jgi:hypothetical protein
VNCWDRHPAKGIVSNQDPWGEDDKSRALHARVTCDRPRCIAAAKGQVRIHTGEPGTYYPYPERAWQSKRASKRW